MRSFCSTRNLTSLVSCLFFNIQHFFLLPYSVFYGWRTACIFIGHIMLESQHFGVWLQYLKSNFNLYQAKLARWEMKKKKQLANQLVLIVRIRKLEGVCFENFPYQAYPTIFNHNRLSFAFFIYFSKFMYVFTFFIQHKILSFLDAVGRYNNKNWGLIKIAAYNLTLKKHW